MFISLSVRHCTCIISLNLQDNPNKIKVGTVRVVHGTGCERIHKEKRT